MQCAGTTSNTLHALTLTPPAGTPQGKELCPDILNSFVPLNLIQPKATVYLITAQVTAVLVAFSNSSLEEATGIIFSKVVSNNSRNQQPQQLLLLTVP